MKQNENKQENSSSQKNPVNGGDGLEIPAQVDLALGKQAIKNDKQNIAEETKTSATQVKENTDTTAPAESIVKESNSQNGKASENEKTTTNDALQKAEQEIAELKDAWSRERAEFMNFRKRTQQERSRQEQDAVASFIQDLLPAFDNIDQVINIQTENSEVKKYVDGVSMIRDNFFQILANKKVKALQPLEEKFNPQFMEAISIEELENLQEDTVLEVYQTGYYMESEDGQKHLLRPARVRVAKAKGT